MPIGVVASFRGGHGSCGAECRYVSSVARWLGLPDRTQRVADYDSLPAQFRHRNVVALGQIAALIVSRKEVVGAHTRGQVGLVNVAGRSGRALMNEVRDQPLGGTG